MSTARTNGMQIIGNPPPKLARALAVIDSTLHNSFDLRGDMDIGKSKDSCVLCALTVRDFLRALDMPARVTPVTLVMWANEHGEQLHSLGVGTPHDRQVIPGRWNGHLVTTVNRWLIDCVLYQSQRPQWEGLSGMMALQLLPRVNRPTLPIYPNHPVIAGMAARDNDPGRETYEFAMAWLDRPENQSWREGPDARDAARRAGVVQHLLDEFRAAPLRAAS